MASLTAKGRILTLEGSLNDAADPWKVIRAEN
jgi:hypothetical protein